jgi:hypothetical protein
VYRGVGVAGDRTPLCRKCADWYYSHDELPPVQVVGVWAKGETLTSSKLRDLRLDDHGRPLPLGAIRKKKRRR